jgi:hypothetical protein
MLLMIDTTIRKLRPKIDIGNSRSDCEFHDEPLTMYGTNCSPLSYVPKLDNGIRLALRHQLRVGVILDLERITFVMWIE